MRAAPKAVIASPSDATIGAPGIGQSAAPGATGGTIRGATPARKASRAAIALGDAAAFDRCLARPALVRSGPFALHLFWQALLDTGTGVPVEVATAPCWRLGLVIPKRYEASAVARNTIKRRWRDAFRRGRDTWAEEFGSVDVVVRMQAPLQKKTDAPLPARVRARERFDPQDAFASLAARLRSRRPRTVASSSASSVVPSSPSSISSSISP